MENLEQRARNVLGNFNPSEVSNFSDKELMEFEPALASYLDYTILKSDASTDELEQFCTKAVTINPASVCIHPGFVAQVKDILKGLKASIKVCAVVGFPLGANLTSTKLSEINDLARLGVDEIDFVAPIYLVKQNKWQEIFFEFDKIRKQSDICIKVILETCLLNDLEKVMLSLLAVDVHFDYLKTSTGFSKGGASLRDVNLLKLIAKDKLKVKASGGVRSKKMALTMIKAGCSRIGASLGPELLAQPI